MIVDTAATRIQVLPDLIDVSFVLSFSGFGGLLATFVAAVLGLHPDRLARLVVFGNLVGALLGSLLFLLVALGIIA